MTALATNMRQPRIDSIVPLERAIFIRRLDELIRVHLAAMNYSPTTFSQRKSLWRTNIDQPRAQSFCALRHPQSETPDPANPEHEIIGICFSFHGGPKTWWYQQVARGLWNAGCERQEILHILADYDEVSEVHVAPDHQGKGLGTSLLTSLLGSIDSSTAMLSTPEVRGENNGAWHLYRKMGFQDLLRDFHFPADSRGFGILYKLL